MEDTSSIGDDVIRKVRLRDHWGNDGRLGFAGIRETEAGKVVRAVPDGRLERCNA